jgi:hypothetical protein
VENIDQILHNKPGLEISLLNKVGSSITVKTGDSYLE